MKQYIKDTIFSVLVIAFMGIAAFFILFQFLVQLKLGWVILTKL